MLASHAKELILKTKLIYIKHISPSYFLWSALDYLLYSIVRCTGNIPRSESGYASSTRKFGNFDKFPLIAFSRIICYYGQNKQWAVLHFVRDFDAYPQTECEVVDYFCMSHTYIYMMHFVLLASIYIRLYTQIKIEQSFVEASETKRRELKKVEQFSNVSWKSII